jgi:hypothetical protein
MSCQEARAMKLFLPLLVLAAAHAARAHDGHGQTALSHWHASDVLGFILAAAVAAGILWWRGRK